MNNLETISWDNIDKIFETTYLDPTRFIEALLDNVEFEPDRFRFDGKSPILAECVIANRWFVALEQLYPLYFKVFRILLSNVPKYSSLICRILKEGPTTYYDDNTYEFHDEIMTAISENQIPELLDAVAHFIREKPFFDFAKQPPILLGTSESAFDKAMQLMIDNDRRDVLPKLWDLASVYSRGHSYTPIAGYIAKLGGVETVSALAMGYLKDDLGTFAIVDDVADTILGFGDAALPYLKEPLFDFSEFGSEKVDFAIAEIIIKFGYAGIEYLAEILLNSDFLRYNLSKSVKKIEEYLSEDSLHLFLFMIHNLSIASDHKRLSELMTSINDLVILEDIEEFIDSDIHQLKNGAEIFLKFKK
jgi:hypothetical protein